MSVQGNARSSLPTEQCINSLVAANKERLSQPGMGAGDRASPGHGRAASSRFLHSQPVKWPNGKFMEANSRAVNLHYRSKCLQTSFGAGFDVNINININIPEELPGNPGCERQSQQSWKSCSARITPCPRRGCSGICCIPEPGNQWLSSITLALVCVQRGKSFLREM